MHKPFALSMLAFLLLAGCVSDEGADAPLPDQTAPGPQVPGPADTSWARCIEGPIEFEYPSDMELESERTGAGGIITATHETPERTGEILAIAYTDIAAAYGPNQALSYSKAPQPVASLLLSEDLESDSMGFLMKASSLGDIRTYSIAKDLLVAEAPFTLMLNTGTIYHGHALSIYAPAKGLHLNIRIIALEQEDADKIKDNLLLTLRLR